MSMTNSESQQGGSLLKLLLPVLLLAGVAYGGYWFYSSRDTSTSGPVEITPEMLQKAGESTVQVHDTKIIEGHVSVVLDGLLQSLTAIKDDAGVQTTSEALFDASEQWASLHSANWPDDAKLALQPLLTSYIQQIEAALPSAYQVPGAQNRLESDVNNLLDKIKTGLPSQ